MTDLRTLDHNINGTCQDDPERRCNDNQKLDDFEPAVYDALKTFCQQDTTGLIAPKKALQYTHYNFQGFRYTNSVSNRKESIVFFRAEQGGPFTAGAIRQIFSLPTADGATADPIVMAVEPFEAVTDSSDPFVRWRDFGAGLWRAPAGTIQIIRPSSAGICHANQRKWDDNTWVMRPLNQVNLMKCYFPAILNPYSQRF
jgi:hypothetical protein